MEMTTQDQSFNFMAFAMEEKKKVLRRREGEEGTRRVFEYVLENRQRPLAA